jgi:hypothetical protein
MPPEPVASLKLVANGNQQVRCALRTWKSFRQGTLRYRRSPQIGAIFEGREINNRFGLGVKWNGAGRQIFLV